MYKGIFSAEERYPCLEGFLYGLLGVEAEDFIRERIGSAMFLMALRSFSAEERRVRARLVSLIECPTGPQGVRHDVITAFFPLVRLFGCIDQNVLGRVESRKCMPQPGHLFSAAPLEDQKVRLLSRGCRCPIRGGHRPGPGIRRVSPSGALRSRRWFASSHRESCRISRP